MQYKISLLCYFVFKKFKNFFKFEPDGNTSPTQNLFRSSLKVQLHLSLFVIEANESDIPRKKKSLKRLNKSI